MQALQVLNLDRCPSYGVAETPHVKLLTPTLERSAARAGRSMRQRCGVAVHWWECASNLLLCCRALPACAGLHGARSDLTARRVGQFAAHTGAASHTSYRQGLKACCQRWSGVTGGAGAAGWEGRPFTLPVLALHASAGAGASAGRGCRPSHTLPALRPLRIQWCCWQA